jgi:pyrimidine operon attenuation protein/uracil phosphoribosyltransferase
MHPILLARGTELSGKTNGTERIVSTAEFASIYRSWMSRLSAELAARAGGGGRAGPWAIVGIKRCGALLARRLWRDLSVAGEPLLYGEVDISLYRDDYHLQGRKATVLGTEIQFPVDGVNLLLVDDVLYTGRTVRAAMDLILDFGRPRVILLAVFIDRGHRELPIAANFVGKEVPTAHDDKVLVALKEMEGEDTVELVRARSPAHREEGRSGAPR